jgi:hypothetical protein
MSDRDAIPARARNVGQLSLQFDLASPASRADAADHRPRSHRLLPTELVARNRDAYLPNLALRSSTSVSIISEAGRRAEALNHQPGSHRLLPRNWSPATRDAYLPDLAIGRSSTSAASSPRDRAAAPKP